jgi:hypothetical protein
MIIPEVLIKSEKYPLVYAHIRVLEFSDQHLKPLALQTHNKYNVHVCEKHFLIKL